MAGLLIGLIPLIIFAIIDAYASLNVALIAMIIATIIEVTYSIYMFGGLDAISIVSIVLVIILCGISYMKKSSVMIKLKPAILSGFGGSFSFYSLIKQPFLITLLNKYAAILTPEVGLILKTEIGQQYFGVLSLYLGYTFIAHAALVYFTGVKTNNFWWGLSSTLGFLLFMIIATICANLTVSIYS